MDADFLIPIFLFGSFAYIIKVISDNRLKRMIVEKDQVSEDMKSMLEPLKEYIEEKTGAEKMEISCVDPVKKHTHTSTFKVKREEFDVWIDKV